MSKGETAEEVVVALAITGPQAAAIIADSKATLRNYARGRISTTAAQILTNSTTPVPRHIRLVWTPAHSSLQGDEMEDEASRGCTNQPDFKSDNQPSVTVGGGGESPATYRQITQQHRLSRLKFPAAHTALNKWQTVARLRLQSNMFSHPALCHRSYPDRYTDRCKCCNIAAATLQHIIWQCPNKPRAFERVTHIRSSEQWEAALLSSLPEKERERETFIAHSPTYVQVG
ncbi:hypothetical protein HPB48_018995 [Haemaphysalis longicornis]|uniref:Tick transposon n=1 Tax=Haemaphysalis longicornis TaxID=44386 RepID=A0A9J6GCE9_HAELO|nr:hypothetical protein HPB48_018995 [Haemaphysalis longicornis]